MLVSAKKKKVITIDPEKCTGCHSCEMACSMKHFGKCAPNYSRIRIHEFRDVNTFIPIMCQACEDAPCIKVCPTNSRIRLENGSVVTNEDTCIGCNACTYACPFGASFVNPDTGKTMSCDGCGDDEEGPWCVRACTMQGALQFVDAENASQPKGRDWAKLVKSDYEPPVKEGEEKFQFSFGGEE